VRTLDHDRSFRNSVVLRFAVPVVFPAGLAASVRSAPVVAVIPSRFHSSRFPGKPLALVDDKPMIEHVIRRAGEARRVSAVVVATDDERIAAAVDACGATAVMTRRDHETGTDRLAEVARHLDADVIVNVQGDEPLIAGEAIDAAVGLLTANGAEVMSTLRRRIANAAELDDPSLVKVVVDRDGYALYFTRAAVPFVRAGHPAPPLWAHLGLYAYRREFLLTLAGLPPTPLERAEGLEQLRALEHGYRIRTAETTAETVGVDTPEDLERVRRLVEAAART
jgi:3-deoxy-manno-octulosonate cytidylyltransferase (CMP-KDO synthetase)